MIISTKLPGRKQQLKMNGMYYLKSTEKNIRIWQKNGMLITTDMIYQSCLIQKITGRKQKNRKRPEAHPAAF